MHCPSCGQEQATAEIRFCSRCGLPMGLVSQLVAHGGFLPNLPDQSEKKPLISRKVGVFVSITWFVMFTMMITALLSIVGAEEIAAIPAVIGVFGSFLILMFSLFFLKSSKTIGNSSVAPVQQRPASLNPGQPYVLPGQESIPASSYMPPQAGSWRDTNDLVGQGSVVEDTTRFLDKDPQK